MPALNRIYLTQRIPAEQAGSTAFQIGDRVVYVGAEHWGLGIIANIKLDGLSVFFPADLTGMVWFEPEEAAAMLSVVARASYAPPKEQGTHRCEPHGTYGKCARCAESAKTI